MSLGRIRRHCKPLRPSRRRPLRTRSCPNRRRNLCISIFYNRCKLQSRWKRNHYWKRNHSRKTSSRNCTATRNNHPKNTRHLHFRRHHTSRNTNRYSNNYNTLIRTRSKLNILRAKNIYPNKRKNYSCSNFNNSFNNICYIPGRWRNYIPGRWTYTA